eukprot:6454159-Alexandrium_andersonii.AAC.1
MILGARQGKDACAFIDFVSVEVLLQLSVMADAMDEAMAVVRFADSETYDSAKLEGVCHDFIERASVLFDSG